MTATWSCYTIVHMTSNPNIVKIPLTGGDEQDLLSPSRRFHFSDYGRSKAAKRSYARRVRRTGRQALVNGRGE